MPRGGPRPQCRVDGCSRPHKAQGWCDAHYQRLRKQGDVRPDAPVFEAGLDLCRRGHALTPINTKRIAATGARTCRTCIRDGYHQKWLSDRDFRDQKRGREFRRVALYRQKASVLDAMLEEMGLTWEEFMEDQDVSA